MSTRYDAIIFDLFGTLVDNFAGDVLNRCLTEMADALHVDDTVFIAIWTEPAMISQRMTSAFSSIEACLACVSRRLAIQFDVKQIAKAKQIRETYARRSLMPRDHVIATLSTLKTRGYALGLLCNCTWEVPALWDATPFGPLFDRPIFSCVVGKEKPDPRIYQLACEYLQTSPARCLFVGDGSNRELTGARQAGMDAMLICALHERDLVMQRDDPRLWDGPVIERIPEVLKHLR